jgi:hypothetical protein
MRTTLKELAASGDLASSGAAARIKAGYADSTPLKDHCRSDVPARAARYPTDAPARGERRAAREGEDESDRGDLPPTPNRMTRSRDMTAPCLGSVSQFRQRTTDQLELPRTVS